MKAHARGNYYRLRTRKWLEAQGFTVAPMEYSRRIYIPAKDSRPERVIFQKSDIWGADLLASDGQRLVAVQVKTNPGHVSQGVRELRRAPWPESVDLWVVRWPERARQPDVVEARGLTGEPGPVEETFEQVLDK